MQIKDAISELLKGQDLTECRAESVMDEIMSGEATAAQIGGFLVALRLKGETAEEVTGLTRVMRRNCVPVLPRCQNLVDTCGTGGDGFGTFNISTASAFVAAGAGLAIAKHGNRSVSSKCGSADVLQALGVRLDLDPSQIAACIDEVGIGFLFAPMLHPAMKHVVGPRREMGVRTVFNILGPLANPAGAQAQVLGVYDGALILMIAQVLNALGSRSAYVVNSAEGLDELSTTGPNRVARLMDGRVRSYSLDPADLGLPRAELDDLLGGDAEENAALIKNVLDGEPGPRRDVVLLNAAAALEAGGLAGDLRSGLELAAHSIDAGAARSKLDAMIAFTNNGACA